MSKYDLIIFIGRFQLPHLGQQYIIDQAKKQTKNLLILIGSSDMPRSIKNTFSFLERVEMLKLNNPEENIHFEGIKDYQYNDELWLKEIQQIVNQHVATLNLDKDCKIGLIGHFKDSSSYYLKKFPQWDLIEIKEHYKGLNSTDIRSIWLKFNSDINTKMFENKITHEVYKYICNFMSTDHFRQLVREFKYIENYKELWKVAPYAPTFVTVDTVVIQSGHILLVERGAEPGKGLYALPGGFLDQNETLKEAAIRELREETRLKVPEPVLYGSIVNERIFDKPDRSLRGRTLTYAFHIALKDTDELPPVKGSDDAKSAKWVPLGEVDNMRSQLFEDHWDIIRHFIG